MLLDGRQIKQTEKILSTLLNTTHKRKNPYNRNIHRNSNHYSWRMYPQKLHPLQKNKPWFNTECKKKKGSFKKIFKKTYHKKLYWI